MTRLIAFKKKTVAANGLSVTESSGNVFEDLDLPEPAERLAKAQLARIIRHQVREMMAANNISQARVAQHIGATASELSELVRGNLVRFSQERLERYLNRLELHVNIQVGPRRAAGTEVGVTVEEVASL